MVAPTRDGRAERPNGRPHVAMVLYQDLTADGRVQREASSLVQSGYRVTIYCHRFDESVAGDATKGVRVVARPPTATSVVPGTRSPFNPGDPGTRPQARGGRAGWAMGYGLNLLTWGRWAVRTAGTPAIWHAHDLTGLLAVALGGLSRTTPLIYDSHELFMELGSASALPGPMRRGMREFEGRLARRAAGVLTVNEGLAEELSRRYRVNPVVVLNCLPYSEIPPPGRLRSTLGLRDEQILLYHGAVTPRHRGIETTVEALRYLPPSVVLVVLGNGSLVPWVQQQAQRPELAGRIFWHPAVPLSELPSWIVDADIGVILLAPHLIHFRLSTPNKLFECMAAGLPVIASDFPAMSRIVLDERIGEVCDPTEPRLIADRIQRMLAAPAELEAMRDRARNAARSTYNWDAQATSMLGLYRRLVPVGNDQGELT